jgi:murein DD-endopeptidase MepM/ murein hydrolase activator NlpD
MSDFVFEFWPTEHCVITQAFGSNPKFYADYGLPGHEGIDLRAPAGSAIYSVAPGTVRAVHANLSHPYGLHVRIDHADGYQTIYAHLTRSMVAAGDTVLGGQQIGVAGSTGNSTGAHLHLTLKQADSQTPGYPPGVIDPWPYLDRLACSIPATIIEVDEL